MQRLRHRFRHNISLGRIKRRRKLIKIIRKRQLHRRGVFFRQELEQ